MQHRGGLTPPPAGRRRRATKPSSTTQHCLKKVYLHPTPLRRSWHTCMNKLASNGETTPPTQWAMFGIVGGWDQRLAAIIEAQHGAGHRAHRERHGHVLRPALGQ